jgi:hypothetical protein
MPRPCHDRHALSPESCRLCWLFQNRPDYRHLWSDKGGIVCKHLGEPSGESKPCSACGVGTVQVPLMQCGLHGRCVTGERMPFGVASCRICPDREGHFPIRDLAFHIYPMSGNGVWQQCLDHLIRRKNLFTGKKVFAIGTGEEHLSPTEEVIDYLEPMRPFEVLFFANDPTLREVVTAIPMLEKLQSRDPERVLMYGHAKGVTRPMDDGSAIPHWVRLEFELMLDYWDTVERILTHSPIAGPFKKVGAGFLGSRSSWHYSGSFWWARSNDLFGRNWRDIERFWWGIESYPSLHFAEKEAGCIFHQGVVPTLDLYDLTYVREVVLPQYEVWKQKRQGVNRGTVVV